LPHNWIDVSASSPSIPNFEIGCDTRSFQG
jgi:hypothetical protein